MSSDETVEETNGDSFGKVKQRFKDRSQVILILKLVISLCFCLLYAAYDLGMFCFV